MGINFPSSPTLDDTLVSGGSTYRWNGTLWNLEKGLLTADRYNYVVNPAMQMSQDKGDDSTTSNTAWPAADCWTISCTIGSTADAELKRDSTNLTPAGKPSLICTILATAAVANGSLFYEQKIEGLRVADLSWGTADAKQVILRFQFWSSAVGIFSVAVQNAASSATRSYITTINVTVPNSWQLYTLVIPGDTTGTWVKDNTCGLKFLISMLGVANTYAGVPGWQAGDKGWLTTNYDAPLNGGTFKLGDVGLYADPLLTGKAPPFEVPSLEADMLDCFRYYWKGSFQTTQFNVSTYIAGGITTWHISWPVIMRVVPTVTGNTAGVTGTAVIPPTYTNVMTNSGVRIYSTSAAASGNAYWSHPADNYIAASARM
jgi:hypothetical protein